MFFRFGPDNCFFFSDICLIMAAFSDSGHPLRSGPPIMNGTPAGKVEFQGRDLSRANGHRGRWSAVSAGMVPGV